jgi:phosphoglycolate phosphatase-like HAD superfamily hydrolase
MQLFGHPLQLVILDVKGVILDLMADFERHLEAAAGQLHLPTEPIRHYRAAVRGGARHSFVKLPEALQARKDTRRREAMVEKRWRDASSVRQQDVPGIGVCPLLLTQPSTNL